MESVCSYDKEVASSRKSEFFWNLVFLILAAQKKRIFNFKRKKIMYFVCHEMLCSRWKTKQFFGCFLWKNKFCPTDLIFKNSQKSGNSWFFWCLWRCMEIESSKHEEQIQRIYVENLRKLKLIKQACFMKKKELSFEENAGN